MILPRTVTVEFATRAQLPIIESPTLECFMSSRNRTSVQRKLAPLDQRADVSLTSDYPEYPVLDLSASTFNRALRNVALEELKIVRARYIEHGDPIRCAVGISLVLRSLAKELFGEERINRLRRVSWLNFLLRTSGERHFRPHVIETMSAALFGDPPEVALPGDCGFWFEAAEQWIEHQRNRRPLTTCEAPVESDV